MAARSENVGENHGRTAEDIVFQLDAGVHGDIVLNLYVVADANTACDVNILAKIASLTDLAIRHDVRKMPDFCSVADGARLIENRRRVDVVCRRGRGLQWDWLAVLAQRFAGCVQNLQHAETVYAVRVWRFAGSNAVEKMFTFGSEGLLLFQQRCLAFDAVRYWHAIDPLNAMGIENELCVRLRIIEHRHFAIADNDQLLLLEGVQPTDENVRLHATGKIQERERHIGDRMIQVAAALRCDGGRIFLEQVNDCGNIVRREAPEDVLLGSQLSKVEARRADVFDAAKFTSAN